MQDEQNDREWGHFRTPLARRDGRLAPDDEEEVASWAKSHGYSYVSAHALPIGRADFYCCADRHLWEVSRLHARVVPWCPICGVPGRCLGVGRTVT
jgi:hypothetical protein